MLRGYLAIILLVGVGFCGCGRSDNGPQRHHVEGTVEYDGKPLVSGRITFVPDHNAGNSGPVGYAMVQDGKFTTHSSNSKGSISGVVNVLITGYDHEGGASAQPLFEDHPETATIDPEQKVTKLDFKIEKPSTKKR